MQLAPAAVKQMPRSGKGESGAFLSGPISNPQNIPSTFTDPFQNLEYIGYFGNVLRTEPPARNSALRWVNLKKHTRRHNIAARYE